ncbi:DM13 domain-containing protein [Actinoplanes sp. NPDC049802]|uniref:DM13 domain-containing protein n=1 Tax=Actinoplanes sp. NPDC049802 TaxID=3154742 RepID=UPI0033D4C748
MIRRVIAALAALVAVAALYWFQPWKLFTDRTVSETLPPVVSIEPSLPAGPGGGEPSRTPSRKVVARGEFVTHEHDTTGAARLVRETDGTHRLELVGLDTSNGPDLRVWLSDQPVREGRAGWHVFDDGDHVELGRLKGNRGDQSYAVGADVDLERLRSVSIWCERFSVSFGAAELR